MNEASASGAAIVIPTLLPERTASALSMHDVLEHIGTPILVCNSAGSFRLTDDAPWSGRIMCTEENLGYGQAANTAADLLDPRPHRGMLILNDDVMITNRGARQMLDSIDSTSGNQIVLFHAGPAESKLGSPGAVGALMRISGLWMLRKFLPPRFRGRAAPFYAAYIDWDAWDSVGGLDYRRFPFYFEDADLLRKATRAGIEVVATQVDIKPVRSATSRTLTTTIVCEAEGCLNYISPEAGPTVVHASVVRLALLVRAAVELVRGQRARARVALSTALTRRSSWSPLLPSFEDID